MATYTSMELSPQNVVTALQDLSVDKTTELVFHLGVEIKVLDDIALQYSGISRKIHSIQAWLDSDTSASWEKMVSGLKEIGMTVVAERVKSTFVLQVEVPVTVCTAVPVGSASVPPLQAVSSPAPRERGHVTLVPASASVTLPPHAEVHRYVPISSNKECTYQIQNGNSSTKMPSGHPAPAEHMYGPYPSPYNPQYVAPQGMYNFPMQVSPWDPTLSYPMQWPHANFGHPSTFHQPMQGRYAGAQPPTAIANRQLPPNPSTMQWPHGTLYPQNPPQLDQCSIHKGSETPSNSNAKEQLTPTQSHLLESTTDEELTMKAHLSLRFCHDGPSVKQHAQQHEKPKAPLEKPKKKVNHLAKVLLSKLEDEPKMVSVQDPHIKPRLAECVIAKCSCDTKVKPLTYTLELKREKIGKKLDKYTFGSKPRGVVPEKVLMIVGATEAGKSTLINGMINYIFGVRWEDKFRFKMIVENTVIQANSATQKITAYTIYHQEGSPINFTLTIVDTPGFGDAQGLERNRRTISQIKDFFSLSPFEGGVDHLDAIGFVAQASLARLTLTQCYIFNSILSLFGKNVWGNIFMMITFADGSKPPVVDAIKVANIPYKKFLSLTILQFFLAQRRSNKHLMIRAMKKVKEEISTACFGTWV